MEIPNQEERRAIYEKLASEDCGEFVAVKFEDDLRYGGVPCYGLAHWNGRGNFEILLRPHLTPEFEAAVAGHETAHIRLKHVAKIAPTYARRITANISAAEKNYSGPEQDAKRERKAEREAQADMLGNSLVLSWRCAKRINW